MRRFRRRRPRVVWLPNTGTQFITPGATPLPFGENPSGLEFIVTLTENNPLTVETPMVTDQPIVEELTAEGVATVADYQKRGLNETEQKAYRLRRIVGELFVGVSGVLVETNGSLPAVMVCCGIIVRRVSPDTGGSVAIATEQDVNTLQNNADPWIWRRNWILGGGTFGQFSAGTETEVYNSFPQNNANYGTNGPKVDAKTNRVISEDERLIFNLTAWTLPYNQTGFSIAKVPTLCCNFEYRALGSVFTQAGNRRNAVR